MLSGPDLGTVTLEGALIAPVPVENYNGTPTDPAQAPTYRVYGQAGLMPGGTGSLAKLDVQNVTAALNQSPVQLTVPAHKLQTGTRVNVSGVGGLVTANGETTVTVVDANHVTLDGTSASNAYTSGGQVHVAGLYQLSLTVSAGNGYAAGGTYYVMVSWTVSGQNYAMLCPFRVV
jgi:hypothetical protein